MKLKIHSDATLSKFLLYSSICFVIPTNGRNLFDAGDSSLGMTNASMFEHI